MKNDFNVDKIKHYDLSNYKSNSTYQKTLDRFEEILTSKLNIKINNKKKTFSKIDKVDSNNFYSNNIEEIENNLRLTSPNAAEMIDKFLDGTKLQSLGKTFEIAQDVFGVNAVFLAALAVHESDYGKSKIAADKKNIFGFGAYDRNPYKYAKSFSSLEESVGFVANYLSKEYLSEGGSFYNGNTLKDVNKKYASDENWHIKVNNIIQEILKNK